MLDDDNIAPESRAFRDALHALCDLLYNQQRYAEAISRLEDMLAFYPDDSSRFRVRFMLGDSYRKSAVRYRDRPPLGADPSQVKRLVRERLRRAADLFKDLLDEIERQPARDDATLLYERLALFYRGDSLFDLNEPQTLQDARTVYQRAAARYARQPAALTAQVQLSNIFLRQGKVAEAARAIEHARWLLDSIPDQAFEANGDGIGRAYWQDYLAKVSASPLLSDVFNSRP
ncbi:MAG: tetratricopeptide repeat protein [Planctomycetes bacterium]|nr:tetratricopeptide repeat protein [Planctomycetota bacterium]